MISKEAMKQEALTRMVILGLRGDTITKFQKDNELTCSMSVTPNSLLDDQLNKVKDFEERTGNLVYHILDDYTSIGEMLTLLYVSADPLEWEQERKDILAGYPMAYVYNIRYPHFSEFGTVGINRVSGSLVRTD